MSTPTRARTGIVLGVATAMVAGALGAALYMALSFGGTTADEQPAQVNVHQAAATAQPTATVTVTKKAAVKVKPAKKAPAKTTTKARTLVSNQAADPAPADEPSEAPPLNGGGRGSDPQPTLVLPTGNPPPGN